MQDWWTLLKEEDTEQVILREIEKEGGALGMKNLREVVPDEHKLKSTLDDMISQGKVFVHEDGDITRMSRMKIWLKAAHVSIALV